MKAKRKRKQPTRAEKKGRRWPPRLRRRQNIRPCNLPSTELLLMRLGFRRWCCGWCCWVVFFMMNVFYNAVNGSGDGRYLVVVAPTATAKERYVFFVGQLFVHDPKHHYFFIFYITTKRIPRENLNKGQDIVTWQLP